MTLKGYKQTEEHIKKRSNHLIGNQYTKGYKWTKEQLERLDRKGENAPNYIDGRWLRKYYCMDCGKEIGNQGSKRCYSCSSKIRMKENWKNPEFKKMKSEQAQRQWQDGRMDGVFDDRKIHIESPSNPEKRVIEMLNQLGISYIFQFRPKGCGKIYDFYISEMNLLIEYDSKYWHSLPENIIRDKEKTEYAKDNGYRLLRFNEDNLNDFKNSIFELIKKGE